MKHQVSYPRKSDIFTHETLCESLLLQWLPIKIASMQLCLCETHLCLHEAPSKQKKRLDYHPRPHLNSRLHRILF